MMPKARREPKNLAREFEKGGMLPTKSAGFTKRPKHEAGAKKNKGRGSTSSSWDIVSSSAHATASAEEVFLYTPCSQRLPDALTVAWCYPANYSIAMASLGYLLLFAQLDKLETLRPTRYSTEDYGQDGQRLRQADVVGFSFSFELDIVEILRCFEKEGFPAYASQRDERFPVVFAGGPVPSTNPEPYALFFDFFLIGEGEELLSNVMQFLHTHQTTLRTEKRACLEALAQTYAGVYVPHLYEPTYEAGGPVLDITHTGQGGGSLREGTLPLVQKQFVGNLDNYVATSPILSEASVFGKSYLVEVMRGCAHRCRFCLASYSTLPTRGASMEAIITAIDAGLAYSNKLGLLGVLVAAHPQFPELMAYLATKPDLQISAGAVRADTVTPALCETLAKSGSTSITIAIESGSAWLRRRINKHLKEEHIFRAAEVIARSGLKNLKLYHMVGLPNETPEHIQESIDLIQRLKQAHPTLKLSVGCSSFVPKAHTPFQWMPRLSTAELKKRQEQFRKGVVQAAEFRPSSARWDTFQALVSRGDRRLAPFLLEFTALGAGHGHVKRAYQSVAEQGVQLPSVAWYAERERPQAECLPWAMLHLGVDASILWKEGELPTALQESTVVL
jgi:radical SAM superfamily enzyme YgiQ (UPF0313 family)